MKNIFIVSLLLIGSISAFAQVQETPVVKITDSISGGQSAGVTTLQSPLYVINGVPVTVDQFKKINANSIVSINVIKDARAKDLYNSDTGVIDIKTKDVLSKDELRKVEREQNELSKKYKRGE